MLQDAVALVVQAAGGAMASSANDVAGSKLGANIMLGGIVFQLSESISKSDSSTPPNKSALFPSCHYGLHNSYIRVFNPILVQEAIRRA